MTDHAESRDLSIPGQRVRHQLHRDAHRRAFRRRSRSISITTMAFRPGTSQDDARTMLDPGAVERAAELYQNRGRNKGDAKTVHARRRLHLCGDEQHVHAPEVRRALRRSRRFHRQPVPESRADSSRLRARWRHAGGMIWYINESFMDGHADMPTSWMSRTAITSMDHRDEVRALYGQPAGDPTLIQGRIEVRETHLGPRTCRPTCSSAKNSRRQRRRALCHGGHRHGSSPIWHRPTRTPRTSSHVDESHAFGHTSLRHHR